MQEWEEFAAIFAIYSGVRCSDFTFKSTLVAVKMDFKGDRSPDEMVVAWTEVVAVEMGRHERLERYFGDKMGRNLLKGRGYWREWSKRG